MNQSHLPGAQIAPPSYYFVSLKSFEIFKPKSTLNSAHKIHKESMVIVDHLIKVEFEVKIEPSSGCQSLFWQWSSHLSLLQELYYVVASDTALMLPGLMLGDQCQSELMPNLGCVTLISCDVSTQMSEFK